MTTLPKFDQTEIMVVDGIITITQRGYLSSKIEVPVELWNKLVYAVTEEVKKQDSYFDTAVELARAEAAKVTQ